MLPCVPVRFSLPLGSTHPVLRQFFLIVEHNNDQISLTPLTFHRAFLFLSLVEHHYFVRGLLKQLELAREFILPLGACAFKLLEQFLSTKTFWILFSLILTDLISSSFMFLSWRCSALFAMKQSSSSWTRDPGSVAIYVCVRHAH